MRARPDFPQPAPLGEVVASLVHSYRKWTIVKVGDSYFARDDMACDTGPYSTKEQAIDWVKGIRP